MYVPSVGHSFADYYLFATMRDLQVELERLCFGNSSAPHGRLAACPNRGTRPRLAAHLRLMQQVRRLAGAPPEPLAEFPKARIERVRAAFGCDRQNTRLFTPPAWYGILRHSRSSGSTPPVYDSPVPPSPRPKETSNSALLSRRGTRFEAAVASRPPAGSHNLANSCRIGIGRS